MLHLQLICALRVKINNEGRRNENGGIGANNNTNHHGKGESTQGFTPKKQEDNNHDQHRAGGHNGAAQRTGYRHVEDFNPLVARTQVHVFPYPVKDDHRVIDRITDDRQYRRHENLVNFQGEAQYPGNGKC